MAQKKKYELDGKMYTIADLVKITGLKYGFIRHRLTTRAVSFDDITKTRKEYCKSQSKEKSNWGDSMMNDKLGHWKLINNALKPHNK